MTRQSQFLRRRLLQGALLAAWPMGWARAQGFPSRTVKTLLPQPPGGAADRLARVIGEKLEARWQQPMVIEHKPGGGVVIGTLATARAPADGHTLGLLGSSMSINAVIRKDLPYDTVKELAPVARIGYYTVALLATPAVAANDIKGLIALAKQQPGKLSFGSNGIGTSAHLAGEMLNHMGGIQMQHVPYNGAAKMYTDMVGGQIPLGFAIVSSAESFIKAGQLKVLGVTSAQRSQLYPEWPAIAETLPGYEAVNWAGYVVPSGTPKDVVQKLADDILAVIKQPDVAKSLAGMGIDVAPQGPAEFEAFVRSEVTRFAVLAKPLSGRMQ
ncbi:tripartite tricarboxylate transporter substrate binding protein [Caenimonas sedimenti]|uniref:Tripartite tricarboxylate transporter substrate binding protein n=1 Tax=Caenimonas sedimenti TaxID=2596921 RepID=A0A562ZM60_9BURK|nr:tripartite tricarboxylate transporter substrate binding protein [Caenimonas sedimenti]TWO69446.1 tripartite tricarboxylate transporter substrate binding protein [Caenimonas sedimenti]